jgi:hypothetical protein
VGGTEIQNSKKKALDAGDKRRFHLRYDQPFLGAAGWGGKIFLISRMRRLKIQSTNMVPDIPTSAKVQPKVQLSMNFSALRPKRERLGGTIR